ncbi:MAG: tRNA lysidine(34) synthetase TilS [bacterium]|nr:tRNA lysidine(34) synthetase TilS [bacterium]
MREKVWREIRQKGMLASDSRVLVALSGGADSVCLFLLLKEWKERGEIAALRALHVHHGLRQETADRDAVFCQKLCEEFAIPCKVLYVDAAAVAQEQHLSVEEAARLLRYEALEAEARAWDGEMEAEREKKEEQDGGCRIAVAHHQDDDAETVLHHLFRGSGLRGLSGILPVRGRIIRPLLGVSREEIREFLRQEKQGWCEDETNADNTYMRNRIRNELLPWLTKNVNAEAVKHICEAKQRIAEADDFLWGQACERYPSVVLEEVGGLLLQKEALFLQHAALRPYLLKCAFEKLGGGGKDWGMVHRKMVLELFERQVGRQCSLPDGILAKRVYEGVRLERTDWAKEKGEKKRNVQKKYEFSLFPYEKDREIPQNRYTKWFDYDKIKNTVSIRHRKSGDFITICGGGRKTIKEYMIHEKIPREFRSDIDLVAEGSHILWIVGYRISEMYKVTEDTRMILQIQRYGGTEDGR